jgi:hypothetical protein
MKNLSKEIKTYSFSLLSIAQFGSLLILISITPLIGNQFITGTVVNAILFLSTILFGTYTAIFLAFTPSFFASISGILPMVILPMIPFIIISNIVLIKSFNYFKNKYWTAIILSSSLKFLFLFFCGNLMINFFLSNNAINPILTIMGWHQLITSISGGIIAFLILKIIKK